MALHYALEAAWKKDLQLTMTELVSISDQVFQLWMLHWHMVLRKANPILLLLSSSVFSSSALVFPCLSYKNKISPCTWSCFTAFCVCEPLLCMLLFLQSYTKLQLQFLTGRWAANFCQCSQQVFLSTIKELYNPRDVFTIYHHQLVQI